MAADGTKLKKDVLVERLARRLARLTRDELEALMEAVEGGAVDFQELARDAVRAAAAEDGPPFGFQRRLQSEWSRSGRSSSP